MNLVYVFLLFGGIVSSDGVVTSVGMNQLATELRALPNTRVITSLWGDWRQTYAKVMRSQNAKVVVIGYSGGGAKATWIANGYTGRQYLPKPRIDLMVLYDPSPTWSMMPIGRNVKRAINYHNVSPMMFGLGGGVLVGPHVTQLDVAMPHLMLQFSPELHRRTVDYVRQLK